MGIYRKYWKTYRLPFILAVSCVFLEAMCDLLQPTIMSHIIDDGVKNGSLATVLRFGGTMLGVALVGAVFACARNLLASRVSQSFGADLRGELFAKILRLSEADADRIESGSLITRLTNDTNQLVLFVNGLMRIFVKAPLTCVGSIVLAVTLSPRLSVVLFVVIGLVAAFIVVSMKLSYRRYARMQAAIDRVNTVVQEALMGVRLVKAFGRFDAEEERFGVANDELSRRAVSAQRVAAIFSPLMTLSVSLGIAAILYAGSLLFGSGSLEVGRIAAFINYMTQILGSLIMITNIFNVFVRTQASTFRINEVLRCGEDGGTPSVVRRPEGERIGEEELAFDRVTFAYPGGSGRPALEEVTFSVSRGETLAVIGSTGSGKSTLAWLLLRFYEPNDGMIRLGGRDVREMATNELRSRIALAPQLSLLFSGTVEENIRWGNPDASEEEIRTAAAVAQAASFIEAMPDGYGSELGQGGVNLSGGQKQRLSIARALARGAEMVVLDDCTSALDALTEAAVRRGLRALSGKTTVLLITQRISTAMGADRILVLEGGRTAGFGTHDQLMAECPVYRDIYESQIGAPEAADRQTTA